MNPDPQKPNDSRNKDSGTAPSETLTAVQKEFACILGRLLAAKWSTQRERGTPRHETMGVDSEHADEAAGLS
jgi:hypothetical protein